MGTRYILTVVCKACGFEDDDVYYAPTCGFKMWKCRECGEVIDLEKYAAEKATSSREEIREIMFKIAGA